MHHGGSPMSPNIARKLVNIFREKNESTVSSALLGKRENDVLELLSQGLLYKEIADRLSLAVGTVRQHIHNIYEKLHVHNRTEALNKVSKNKCLLKGISNWTGSRCEDCCNTQTLVCRPATTKNYG